MLKIADFINVELSDIQLNYICNHVYGGSPTFNIGKIGIWKSFLTEEQKLLCKEYLGEVLIELGYETDYNW